MNKNLLMIFQEEEMKQELVEWEKEDSEKRGQLDLDLIREKSTQEKVKFFCTSACHL